MQKLPDDVVNGLLRGIGAFLKDTPAPELPAKLRRYRNFRPQALNAHRDELLGALDDDALRARIVHWLDKDKPSLSKKDVELLSTAAQRVDGWEDRLGTAAASPRKPKEPSATPAERLATEREKVRKARDEARQVKEQGRAALDAERAKRRAIEADVADLRSRLSAAIKEAAAAGKEASEARDRLEREQRRVRAQLDRSDSALEEARRETKDLRRKVKELEREAERSRAKPTTRKKPVTSAKKGAGPRRALSVPKGRLEDAPETLDEWLSTDDVILLVDGYNVAKAEGAFGDLSLEQQRDRLIAELNRLARSKRARTIVVFDGSKIGGGLARRARGPVEVEYSRPDAIADDHIVAKLKELPPVPVVLTTNDRELQTRGRALKATIATSKQLLGLIRPS